MSEPEIVKTVITDRPRSAVVFEAMSPLAQIVVRAARTYIQALVGFLGVAVMGKPVLDQVGVTIPAGDFLELLKACSSLAVAPTILSLLMNTGEFLTALDAKFPKLRA